MAKDPVSQTMSIAMMADIKRRGGNMDREAIKQSLMSFEKQQSEVRDAQRELRHANHRLHDARTDLVRDLINANLSALLTPDMAKLKQYLRPSREKAREEDELLEFNKSYVTDETKR